MSNAEGVINSTSATSTATDVSSASSTATDVSSATSAATDVLLVGKGVNEWDLASHTYIYTTLQNHVNNPWRYVVPDSVFLQLQEDKKSPFGGSDYRESVFISNYSRLTYEPRRRQSRPFVYYNALGDYKPKLLKESRKERWADVVIRVIEGTMSFYIYHMKNMRLKVDTVFLDSIATKMAVSMYKMEWVCPGRGLFAMGTENTYKIGNAALNNCYGDSTKENLIESLSWAMDMLMCGGGVGLDLMWNGEVYPPNKEKYNEWEVPDSREGWVAAMELLLRAYIPIDGQITNAFTKFKFNKIRPYGTYIKGFGGTASGPEPLQILLKRSEIFLDTYIEYKEFEKKYPEHVGSEAQAVFYLKMFERMITKENDDDVDVYAFEDSGFNSKVKKLITKVRSIKGVDVTSFYELYTHFRKKYNKVRGYYFDEDAKEGEDFVPSRLRERIYRRILVLQKNNLAKELDKIAEKSEEVSEECDEECGREHENYVSCSCSEEEEENKVTYEKESTECENGICRLPDGVCRLPSDLTFTDSSDDEICNKEGQLLSKDHVRISDNDNFAQLTPETYEDKFFLEVLQYQKDKDINGYLQCCIRYIHLQKLINLFGIQNRKIEHNDENNEHVIPDKISPYLSYYKDLHLGLVQTEYPNEEENEKSLQYWVKYFYYQKVRNEIYTSSLKYYKPYNVERLIVDLFNAEGACVHAGNVRRSAQIVLGDPHQETFLDMKDWMRYPLRRPYMNFSNNSIRLWSNEDFKTTLPKIIDRMKINGEPGILNMMNIRKYGRFTDQSYGPDNAIVINPCGETPLEKKEACTLSNIVPMNCLGNNRVSKNSSEKGLLEDVLNEDVSNDDFEDLDCLRQACHNATFYAMVVVCVPHHWHQTNEVIARNRRIGVSCTGITDVYQKYGIVNLITMFKEMYKEIRKVNKYYANHFGIPESIRVTLVKPDGSVSLILNSSPGAHYPIIKKGQRDISYIKNSNTVALLIAGGYTYFQDPRNPNTYHIKFPFKVDGKSAKEVSIWKKFALCEAAAKFYADQAISFTGDFDAISEIEDIKDVISFSISRLKSISAFPQMQAPGKKKEGVYASMSDKAFEKLRQQYSFLPYEELNDEDYEKIASRVTFVDWNQIYDPDAVCKFDASKNANTGCSSCVAEDVFE